MPFHPSTMKSALWDKTKAMADPITPEQVIARLVAERDELRTKLSAARTLLFQTSNTAVIEALLEEFRAARKEWEGNHG